MMTRMRSHFNNGEDDKMQKISNEELLKVVQVYNDKGKAATYDLLESRYNIKNPYFVMKRIKKDSRFEYNENQDHFELLGESDVSNIFMSMDELCSPISQKNVHHSGKQGVDERPVKMEKLIQELLGDRLLELSKYITLDSSTKTMMIDQTSLKSDGYHIITH